MRCSLNSDCCYYGFRPIQQRSTSDEFHAVHRNLFAMKAGMSQFLGLRIDGKWTSIFRIMLAMSMLFAATVCEAKDPIRVTFINPSSTSNPFWNQVTNFMQVVARNLDMQLDVRYANDNRYEGTNLATKALASHPKPDFLIYIYQTGQGQEILSAAESAKVYSFIINTDVNDSDRETVGKPREKFKYWIGHLFPDDVAAGQELANRLFEAAKAQGKLGQDGRVHAVALSGGRDSSAALDRNEGLQQALQSHPEVTLHQLVFTNWEMKLARSQTQGLLKRYPEASVVWAASDFIALGAIEAIEENKKNAGADVLAGGFDWTTAGVHAVKNGKMLATLGGHFMDGGWALVLMHDFYHGIDFAPSGTTIRSRMHVISQENVDSFLALPSKKQWDDIDFRQFSKIYNPKLLKYDFSLSAVLKAKRNRAPLRRD